MLSKEAILEQIKLGNIYVDNAEENVGENFIYVTLGDMLKVYDSPVLDIKSQTPSETINISEEGELLQPNKLYLGRTNEYTKTYGFVPLLNGLEELAAQGMEIHITAGFGDNGFEGTWTLEIICSNPTLVHANMRVGRLYYYPLIGDDSIKYHGKYFGQIDPTESRLSREYDGTEGLENSKSGIKEKQIEINNGDKTSDGAMLTSSEIKKQISIGNIEIANLREEALTKPNSCLVSIGDFLYAYDYGVVDTKDSKMFYEQLQHGEVNNLRRIMIPNTGLLLEPRKVYLVKTNEQIKTNGYIPVLNGRTSFSLLGLSVELTSGYLYDGFNDQILLSLVATVPTMIYPNIEVGNLTFFKNLDYKSQTAGMLSGEEIKRRMETGDIIITPQDNIVINPNSVNLTLNKKIQYYTSPILDISKPNKTESIEIGENGITLFNDRIYLARTNEWTETQNLVPMMSGRSSLGRNGLHVHCSAGMGSIGYKGNWHMGIRPTAHIKVYEGMKCCQLYYFTIDGEITNTYNGCMQNLREEELGSQFYKKIKK